ncbi:MarR family winged helix-turn-helix transcriptional regulator [Nocardia goodfellowii]
MAANAEPQWLTEQQQQVWFSLVGVLTRLPDRLDAQLQNDAGISHFEYQVMAMLSMSPQRTRRMSDLAALANGSLTRLSRTVDRLDKRGWVTRHPDPDDGRSTLAVLTDDGWDKVVDTAPAHVAEVRRLVFDPLTKTQIRQLGEITNRLRQVIYTDGECPPGLPGPNTA